MNSRMREYFLCMFCVEGMNILWYHGSLSREKFDYKLSIATRRRNQDYDKILSNYNHYSIAKG